MSIKLYPPNIAGIIPAFYGTTLVVPFSMNKAVAKREVGNFALKIKTVYNSSYLKDATYVSHDFDAGTVTFDVSGCALERGNYYKIQLAYIYNDTSETIGYYSTVGVVKYTTKPIIKLEGLEYGSGQINMHDYSYTGTYQSTDPTEKAYSYCFNLYDNKNNLVYTSGELLHNTLNDEDLTLSKDTCEIKRDLETNKSYYLEYVVTTTNGLIESSGKYRIMQKKSIDPEIKADLIPILNYENGYVNLTLQGQRNADGVEYAATGAFRIVRASEEDGYTTWDEILRFALYGQQPSRWMWNDFTVKQGVTYKYALQQYSEYLYSNRLESEPIYVDFEHAFLYDGHRQLKIKYNPKVTTFKNDLLESKMDTIGGKYPFIFRNGNVKYKEFPISGLISCQLDEEFLFINEDDLGRFDGTSNLIGENIASEREFKLEVLEWLNNGEPKIFRSPSEGNYIIRLLNVSMTPNDTVGRMLHTFTATAYEIADFTYDNMSDLNLISTSDPTTDQLRWETIELDQEGIGSAENILNYVAVALRFEGMVPGDKIWIDDGIIKTASIYDDDTGEYIGEEAVHTKLLTDANGNPILDENGQEIYQAISGHEVIVGATGSYIVDLNLGTTIQAVNFLGSPDNINANWRLVQHQGTLTYAYYSKVQNRFNTISNIAIDDVPLQQFIGAHDVFAEIEDIKTEIQGFYWIHATLRDIQHAYYYTDLNGNGNYFTSKEVVNRKQQYLADTESDRDILNEALLEEYGLELEAHNLYLTQNLTIPGNKKYYVDGLTKEEFTLEDYSSLLYINNSPIDLAIWQLDDKNNIDSSDDEYIIVGVNEQTFKNPKDIEQISCGNGVYLEVGYQKQTIDYAVEYDYRTYPELADLKQQTIEAENVLYAVIYNGSDDENQETIIEQYRNVYETVYAEFIAELERVLEEQEAAQGDVAV